MLKKLVPAVLGAMLIASPVIGVATAAAAPQATPPAKVVNHKAAVKHKVAAKHKAAAHHAMKKHSAKHVAKHHVVKKKVKKPA